MIAAVYGRTSKETDDAYSVSSQLDAGLSYATTNTLTVPTEYQFREDFTGRLLDRPELAKIRTLIRERKIQALIIYATDRLARRTGVGEILLDEIMEYGAQLHIIQWGHTSKIHRKTACASILKLRSQATSAISLWSEGSGENKRKLLSAISSATISQPTAIR